MYKIEKNRLLFHQYYLEVPLPAQTAMQKLQDVTLSDANRDPFTRLSKYIFWKGMFSNNGFRCMVSPAQISPRGNNSYLFLPQVEGSLLSGDDGKSAYTIKVNNMSRIVIIFFLSLAALTSLLGSREEILLGLLIGIIGNTVVLLHSNYAAKRSVELLNKVLCEQDGVKKLLEEANWWSSMGKHSRN